MIELQSKIKELENTIVHLQEGLLKYEEIIALQQECIIKDKPLEKFQKCTYCKKIFVNKSFLKSHILRKHADESPKFIENDDSGTVLKKLNQETQTESDSNMNFEVDPNLVRHWRSLPSVASTLEDKSPLAFITSKHSLEAESFSKPKPSVRKKISSISRKISKSFKSISLKKNKSKYSQF